MSAGRTAPRGPRSDVFSVGRALGRLTGPPSLVLQPGQSSTIALFFIPAFTGSSYESLTVRDDAANSPVIPLVGVGVQGKLIWKPHNVNFGRVPAGTTGKPRTLTLINPNPVSMTISAITPPADPFTEQGTTCTSTLASKQSCAVTIVFTPPSEGGFVGTVTIADDAAGNSQTVNLVGAGE